MRSLIIVVVLLAVGIAGLGYYRGWCTFSTDNTGEQPSASVTLDKNKFQKDEQKARDAVQGLGQDAKKKLTGQDGKAKERQSQP